MSRILIYDSYLTFGLLKKPGFVIASDPAKRESVVPTGIPMGTICKLNLCGKLTDCHVAFQTPRNDILFFNKPPCT
jgi:hypothetical protein